MCKSVQVRNQMTKTKIILVHMQFWTTSQHQVNVKSTTQLRLMT